MQGFVQEVGKEVYRPALALSSVVPTLGKGLHAGIMCRSISGNLIEKFGKEKKGLHLLIYPSIKDWLVQIKFPLRVFLLENENDHFNQCIFLGFQMWAFLKLWGTFQIVFCSNSLISHSSAQKNIFSILEINIAIWKNDYWSFIWQKSLFLWKIRTVFLGLRG